MIDCVIRNGFVVDGSGRPGHVGDVAIDGGRIVGLGASDDRARSVIDAEGLVVAPGFVDVHTHYDAQLFWDPDASPSLLQGVTSIIAGNCGFTLAPVRTNGERYLETYWARWPGVWVQGDWASVDAAGEWYLHGRSDETIKIAGKRVGPVEVESAVVAAPSVIEAAAVGVRDELTGQAIWVFVVPDGETSTDGALARQLGDLVVDALGKPFRPAVVVFLPSLPKTRNGKVLRRALRALVEHEPLGDLSSLESPETIEVARAAIDAAAANA